MTYTAKTFAGRAEINPFQVLQETLVYAALDILKELSHSQIWKSKLMQATFYSYRFHTRETAMLSTEPFYFKTM